jgi:ABC-type Na+ efflux pump permease subunit
MTDEHKYASPEELRYAKVLGRAVQISFVLLVVTFVLYMFGVLPPLVPNDQLPKYWGMPVAEFVKATHTPTGWGWVAFAGKGDMLNMLGIAALAAVSMISSLAVLPIFARRRETALLLITALQVIVLAISASNILAAIR